MIPCIIVIFPSLTALIPETECRMPIDIIRKNRLHHLHRSRYQIVRRLLPIQNPIHAREIS